MHCEVNRVICRSACVPRHGLPETGRVRRPGSPCETAARASRISRPKRPFSRPRQVGFSCSLSLRRLFRFAKRGKISGLPVIWQIRHKSVFARPPNASHKETERMLSVHGCSSNLRRVVLTSRRGMKTALSGSNWILRLRTTIWSESSVDRSMRGSSTWRPSSTSTRAVVRQHIPPIYC